MAFEDRTEVEAGILECSRDELTVEFCGKDVGGRFAVEAPVFLVRDKDSAPEDVLKLVPEDRSLDIVIEVRY